MNAILGKLGGRKFIVAILGVVAVVVTATTGYELSEEIRTKIIEGIAMIVGGFGIGQGVADGLSGGKTSSTVAASKPPQDAG